MKIQNLAAFCVAAASAVLLGAVGTARAADEWFVLGEQTINSADPSVEIKAEGNRWQKDVKQIKLSVEGADVKITSVVLGWDNRKDSTLTSVGTLKAGGQTAATDAPGRKGRLQSVKIQYEILGDKPTATVKILGFD
jgi:hypothetical protein